MTFYQPGIQTAGVTEDHYLRKIEVTDVPEDEYLLYDHNREVLKDLSCDLPVYESDQIRGEGVDKDGIKRAGFQSEQYLNMRHGGRRTNTEPYLPEGLFIEMDSLARDPRGAREGPDFQKFRDQSFHRQSNHVFRDDGDNSVMEAGVHPNTMQENRRGKAAFYNTKERLKIFSESMGNWHNGSMATKKSTSAHSLVEMDGTMLDIGEATVNNRKDATSQLSNDPSVAWRQATTDHRFKTSAYGHVRVEAGTLTDQDWNRNREAGGKMTHDTVVLNGELINRELAKKMVDLQRGRLSNMEAMTGIDYKESDAGRINAQKLTRDDVIKILHKVQSTTEASAHTLLGAEGNTRGARRHAVVASGSQNGLLTHEVIEAMASVTRKSKSVEVADVQRMVERESVKGGPDRMRDNSRHHQLLSQVRQAAQNVEDTRDVAESMSLTNYSNVLPNPANAGHKGDLVEFAGPSGIHREAQQRHTTHATHFAGFNAADAEPLHLPNAHEMSSGGRRIVTGEVLKNKQRTRGGIDTSTEFYTSV